MGEKMTGYYEIDGGNVCGIQFNGIGSLHESIRYHRYEKLKTISLPKLILFAQEVSDLVENGKIDEGDYNEAKQAVKKLTNFQLIGESLLYICAMFIGIFLYFFLPKNMIKDSILPDA